MRATREQGTKNRAWAMKSLRIELCAIIGLLLVLPAGAQQLELKSGVVNPLYVPPEPSGPPDGDNEVALPKTANSNYLGVGSTGGGSGPIKDASEPGEAYPANPDKSMVLTRGVFGSPFASGVPRYAMGEVIPPPLVQADRTTPAGPGYWRVKPLLPGESLPGVTGTPLGTVEVTQSSENGSLVTVSTVPDQLVVGAMLLGQPITKIQGDAPGPYLVTLAGNANETIANARQVEITPALSYYFSPHSERVYASQPGRVTITWVTRAPTAGADYESLTETFAVSSRPAKPTRKIFWTEGGFDGPLIQITDGWISTVNPIYNPTVPKAVPEEVDIPGRDPAVPNLNTLYFDKFVGVGQLHAYNVEGRILIEYLGDVRQGNDVYHQIGTEVVDIVRIPPVTNAVVHLGQEILPHDGDASLVASPLLSTVQGGVNYYGETPRSDGTTAYWAERETSAPQNPDNGDPASNDAYNRVAFYWLEEGEFGIRWPKFQNRYWLRWSPDLSDYAHYTVGSDGSTSDTGISFEAGEIPEIIFQDDPVQSEAQIDLPTQRFFVTFAAHADRRNRALLKFSSDSGELWYVNVYTQAEDRGIVPLASEVSNSFETIVTVPSTENLAVGMTVSGPGIVGTATILEILDGARYRLSQQIPDATSDLRYNERALESSADSDFFVIGLVDSTVGLLEDQVVANLAGSYVGRITLVGDDFFVMDPHEEFAQGIPYPEFETARYQVFTPWPNPQIVTGLDVTTIAATFTITVPSTEGLLPGTAVTGSDIEGLAYVDGILSETQYLLTDFVFPGTEAYSYFLSLSSEPPPSQLSTQHLHNNGPHYHSHWLFYGPS